jgi:uncharacterized protein YbjT (DUF2867 family)
LIVLVTGATGTLGRRLTGELARRGHEVVAGTSRPGAPARIAGIRFSQFDLSTGSGLGQALVGVEAVIHSATSPSRAGEVDVGGIRRLSAAARPGVHLVFPGIVGSDLIPTRYYKMKTASEQALVSSGQPWTILRATQFHQLIWFWYARRSRNPFLFVPSQTRYQVIDPLEVARRLVDAVEAGPQGRMDDIGGPTAYDAADLARSCLSAIHSRRKVIAYTRWGLPAASLRAGANLSANRAGGETWNEFVARQIDRQRSDRRRNQY